ncbi:OpgC domain-containing protein [Paraburkholderia kururiensis]|uniref:OpgC domain-containing protein n=1 Tax=Paraburkholderia kururiensis TaxID=984307 RepID=UPI0005AA9CB7|nr:OpgC domain-containing protein [Paraburkholderia kururiensis]
MQTDVRRSLEVDFFRGLVLLVIAVDHNSGSVLAKFTLRNFAYCDSSEVFVFLGGYASAAAWAVVCMRRGESAARKRFVKRSGQIYGAYLLTAALMLASGALLLGLHLDSPLVRYTDWADFLARPAGLLLEVASFRRQPYLSAVLPMYVLFALAVPLAVPAAARRPAWLLAGSIALWWLAPKALALLPATASDTWSFNPFAWQLMFVLGMLARAQPIDTRIHASPLAALCSVAALALVLALAAARLHEAHPLAGELKQNLAFVRMGNFVAIAWLAARATHAGWVGQIAVRAPWIVSVGRRGLVCFVLGSVLSVAVDTATHAAIAQPFPWLAGLACDAFVIGTLCLVGRYGNNSRPEHAMRRAIATRQSV